MKKRKTTTTHGGKRSGSGRKLGSGTGRTVVSRSITMSPADWAILDAIRGKMSRGKWISSRLHAWEAWPLARSGRTQGQPS